jgi:hypothetical protein
MAGRTKLVALLTRDAILTSDDRTYDYVDVPEWKGRVRVMSLTGTERDQYDLWLITGKGPKRDVNLVNARAKLVVRAVVDEDGKRIFDEADVVPLGRKNAAAVQRIFDVASKLSGLNEDAIEELTADLGNDQSDDSGSA